MTKTRRTVALLLAVLAALALSAPALAGKGRAGSTIIALD